MMHVTARLPDETWAPELDPARISDLVDCPDALLWVEVNKPEDGEIAILQEEFGFHPLAIEDVVKGHQRPKIDVYDGYYFLVIYCASCDPRTGEVKTRELNMFIGANYVVTVHDEPIQEIQATLEQWRRNIETLGTDTGALVYTLMDRIVDDYFPVIDQIAERIEDLEQHIFEKFDKQALEDIFGLKKEMLMLRRMIAPQRDVFNVLLRRDPAILPAESHPYFQDIYDHTIRVIDSLDTYRDLLGSALDAFLSVQGNRLSQIAYRLTLISTIFLPLTFLTGFFGMNFEGIPFQSDVLLVLAFVSMVVTPAFLYWFVRRRGWHD